MKGADWVAPVVERWLAERDARLLSALETPEAERVFKEAWHRADAEGAKGSRVKAGLAAVREYVAGGGS